MSSEGGLRKRPHPPTPAHPPQANGREELLVVAKEEPRRRSLASRLAHWGPLLALGVITEISVVSVICQLEWWQLGFGNAEEVGAVVNLLIFLSWVAGTIANLLAAAELGPGYVPYGWSPPDPADRARLQYCSICQSYKAPRSHHCRKCGRCVKKMDHHCPWINNCVGFTNQPAFVKFLAFAVTGCSHALFILGPSIYRAVFIRWHLHYQIPPFVYLSVYTLLGAIFGFGLALGVILSVGFLLYVQLASICRNRTGIEDYILKKAAAIRRKSKSSFAYPYAIGWRRSLRETLTWSGEPVGNGIWWSLAPGATQFSLSEEQLRQKAVKRRNAVPYVAVRPFSGRVLTISHGCRTLACTPWTDEARLKLQPHDEVIVTRWAKAWLYGELLPSGDGEGEAEGEREGEEMEERAGGGVGGGGGGEPRRGWFPESAVRPLQEILSDSD